MKEKKQTGFIRDLRDYSKQTIVRLIIGALALLLIVGLGLIYLFYGSGAVFTGFLCIISGLAPILLIFLVFQIIDYVIKKANSQK